MKIPTTATIMAQVFISLVDAAPLKVDLTRRALPSPVTVATARTFLADRK